jgi:hypothetical protein
MGLYKIGWSNNVDKRMKNLVKLPFDIRMIHKIKTGTPKELEASIHERYKDVRVNGEWFSLTEDMLSELLAMQ